jgi:hypothetical protein
MSKVAEVHQCPFQAQKTPLMSTEIHQNPLLSTRFAVRENREKTVLERLSRTLMQYKRIVS